MSAENGPIRVLGNIKERVTSLSLEQRMYAVGVVAYIGLNVADTVTTLSALGHGAGGYDNNPLAQSFIERFGAVAGLSMHKMAIVPISIGATEFFVRRRFGYRFGTYFLGISSIVTGIATVSNANGGINIPLLS